MKKLILCLLLMFSLSAFAASDMSRISTFTTIRADTTQSVGSFGIYTHRLTWTGSGTRTTCQIKLEQSIDGITFSDLIAAQTCTSNGTATAVGYVNYVRIRVTAISGALNTVYARYDGSQIAEASGTVNQGSAGTAWPVTTWAGGTLVSGATAIIVDTTSTQVIAATASNYIYVTHCLVTNSDASVGTLVSLQDGGGGISLYSGYASSAGGGFSIAFPSPLKVPTVGNGLYVVAGTTSAEVYVSCSGFKSTVSY